MSKIAAFITLAALAGGVVLLAGPDPRAQQSASTPAAKVAGAAASDLDVFMQKVLARRDDNWKKLQQYILTEKELVDLRGPGGVPIWGDKREFNWFLKEGFFVKSPTKVNGVTLSDAERRKAEEEYLNRAKEREKRGQGRGQRAGAAADASSANAPATETAETPKDVESLIKQTREPGFISSAYFLRFKFEQGKYALVGHEPFEGRDTVRIEYYPKRLFSHEQDSQQRRDEQKNAEAAKQEQAKKQDEKKADQRTEAQKKEDQKNADHERAMDAAIETALNKVSLVTIWVDPKSFQIVKYTFDNVSLDFLPGSALVRMNDLRASMTMGQPYPDVWLPHDVEFRAGAMLAMGQFDFRLRVDFSDYKLAETSVRIKRPVTPGGSPR